MYKDISDYDIMASALGNAISSGLHKNVVFYCLCNTKNAKDFDIAIQAAIHSKEQLNDILKMTSGS